DVATRYSSVGVTVSIRASSPGLPTPGNGCSRTESIQLNTVLFTAMPKPSVSTATAVNQGLRRGIRNPNVTSFMMEGMAISGPATLIPIVTPYRRMRIAWPPVRLWDQSARKWRGAWGRHPGLSGRASGTRIVMKTPSWGRPSACRGLSGRPGTVSLTYSGVSAVGLSSRARFWRLEISHPGTAGRRGRRPQGWSCPTRLLSPDSWLWLCLPVTPVPTPPRCTRPPPTQEKKPPNPFETVPESAQPQQTKPAQPAPQQPALEAPKPAEQPKAQPGGQVIEAIAFPGARRVPQDTLRALISTKKGDIYNEEDLHRDFMALWNSGRFDDIRMETEPGTAGGLNVRFVI